MLTGLSKPGGVDTRALAKSIRIHALKMTKPATADSIVSMLLPVDISAG